jgi:cellulose synthase operon protein C
MPGLGALGVTFGYVIAMDSPSGRPPGTFIGPRDVARDEPRVHLTMTNFHVPRWFTEGIAVHEETAASPEWGDRLDPRRHHGHQDKISCCRWRTGSRLCASDVSAQVVVSYFEAGRICDYITEKWGWDTMLAMLHDFAAASTPRRDRKELKMEPAEFDKQFPGLRLEAKPRRRWRISTDWSKDVKKVAPRSQGQDYDA